MRRLLTPMVAALVLVMAAVLPISADADFTHATGSVRLAGPVQYASFNAFDYGATGDRGKIQYTNFEFPVAGTGVWHLASTFTLNVYLGGTYPHTMNVDSVVPVSPTATKFSGDGFYIPDPSYTWTVKGKVSGDDIWFDITYTGTSAGYMFHAVGTIAADGSMSGTATDSLGQTPLTWSTPAGAAYEVFSYTASVTCAVVSGQDATFGFVIPIAPLAGTPVVVDVHDGGTPGTNGDTWAHGVGTCGDATGAYAITGGNLVVH